MHEDLSPSHQLATAVDDGSDRPLYSSRSQGIARITSNDLSPSTLTCIFEHLHLDYWESPTSDNVPSRWRVRLQSRSNHIEQGFGWKKRDLLACSLVCKGWHLVARSHAFRDLVLVNRRNHSGDPDRLTRTLGDYDSFLQTSSDVGPLIRRLRLEYRGQYNTGFDPAKISPYMLCQLLQRMPELEDLHLCNVYLTMPPISLQPKSFPPNFTPLALKNFRVSYVHEKSKPDTAIQKGVRDLETTMLLGLVRRADELHLIGRGIHGDQSIYEGYDGPASLEVSKLVLERADNGPTLLSHLSHASSLNCIRHLVLRMVATLEDDYDMVKNPRFLSLISPTVETMEICLQRSMMPCECR